MAIRKKKSKVLDDTPKVNGYMERLEHPFKAEVEAVRRIILGVDDRITEGVKWNAPCFYYKGDITVFNLHTREHIHLVFPSGEKIPDTTGLLEGDYPDGRRMAYFKDMDDVNAKKAALETVVRAWITLMDSQSPP
jgi:hypothetical protein